MNNELLAQKRHRVSTRETECYFFDTLVYVEGETERQLFTNDRILGLFKSLRKIHFYSFDNNEPKLKAVH